MWIWKRIIKPVLEWVEHFEAVQTILHTEAYKNWIAPLFSGVMTAGLGISEGVPLIWVAVGTSLVMASVAQYRLRIDEWRERNDPVNKIVCEGVSINVGLTPTQAPAVGNRHQRLAQRRQQQPQILGRNHLVAGVPRTLDDVQVYVRIRNRASFPICVILANAETKVSDLEPPRSKFPKKPSTIPAGGVS